MAVEIVVVADHEDASARVAAILADAAPGGRTIALSGGSTPRRAYELAATLEPDWGAATVWLVDERCVPPADALANARLVRETILERVVARPRFHPVATELGHEAAAAAYDELLRSEGLPQLVLLGMGGDGHVASLFPHAPALDEQQALAVATKAGMEPFVPRISMTLPAIAAADHVVFLITSADKADLVRLAFAGEPSPAVPASMARSAAGRTTVVLDRAAARCL